jgi:hypothetical protein
VTTSGLGVSITSASTVLGELTWLRIGTSLTINQTAHPMNIGEMVIVRNVNVPVVWGPITSATANDFTIACADSGDTTGTEAIYSTGFTFVYDNVPGAITKGTLQAPADVNVQLLSMRIHLGINTRAGTTFELDVPASAYAGAGINTDDEDVNIPIYFVRSDADTLAAVSATIEKNVLGDFSVFKLGNLGVTSVGRMLLLNF